eukprot:TRINITY_DN22951_c0_g1_i1.p1 TRINITY_DN22951_c0_g1~~TRINITY_DN22951_c0_g1_i1.p1  ORF type:complete len:601 (-),score=164.04 TRINITY_DN22951_c0_g1_i1:390-2192(-)
MATLTAGSVLRISPLELSFPVELHVETHISLHLENISSTECAAFKVKTNASQRYFVQPPSGLLPPGGSTDVTLTMVAQSERPASEETRDKFLVQAVQMRRGATEADVPLNLKDVGVPVHEARLSVKHVAPPSAPAPAPILDPEHVPAPATELAANMALSSGENAREGPTATSSADLLHAPLPQENGPSERSRESHMASPGGAEAAVGISVEEHQVVTAELARIAVELDALRGSSARQAEEAEAALAELRRELEEERQGRERERQEQQMQFETELQTAQEANLEREERARSEGQQAAQRLQEDVDELRGLLTEREMELNKLRRTLEERNRQIKEKEDALLDMQASQEFASLTKNGGGEVQGEEALQSEEAPRCSVVEHETLQAAYLDERAHVERLRKSVEESESTKAAALSTLSAVQVDLELTSKRSGRLKEDLELALREGDRLRSQLQKLQSSSSSSSSQQAAGKSAQVVSDEEHWRKQMELENVRRENAATIAAIDELRSHSEEYLREKVALEEVLAKLEITDARHPQHSLKLVPTSSSLSSTFHCSACLRKGRGWLWECMGPSCDYCLHLQCSTINTGADPRISPGDGRTSWARGKEV